MSEYRDRAFAQLNVLDFFGKRVSGLKRLNDEEHQFLCPFHDDKVPSANVNISSTLWFCHACGAKGSAVDLVMEQDHVTFKEALTIIGTAAGMEPPTLGRGNGHGGNGHGPTLTVVASRITEDAVKGWCDAALRNADLMRWLQEHRGYTPETIAKWQIGWDGSRVTIPVRDERSALVNVRRYMRDSHGTAGKMIGFAAGTNEARLFPIEALAEAEILLVEGEWDAILARQYGINAMTVTSGAGIFNHEWVDLFDDKQVTICYDNDKAGQDGAVTVAGKLASHPSVAVAIATIPGLPDKGDITDFFVEQARSLDELKSLLLDAVPFLISPVVEVAKPALPVSLANASSAIYRDQLLSVPVLVSGKAMTPYTVPLDFTVKCDMTNKRLCGVCPLKLKSGISRTQLAARDPHVLELINVATSSQEIAMRKLAGAVGGCPRGIPTIHASTNIEELRVIPEIDTSRNAGESEHVSRTAYYIGHGLRSNRGYEMRGYTHPLPKTQATVHLFSEATPAQDNISAFAMTPEVHSRLRIFAASGNVEDRLKTIYNDLRLNLHRIQGRFDMQVAYDLVWHSVIAFTFNGSYVRRGWTECMVIGDSGQGKTEMALALLLHYRMGERVQGEQASLAGLVGGLEKMADTWMLGWGKVPQNDKRLLIIDETQGLQAGQIEAMSDVRATGVAEITKIRTEKTNARCRLVWLANPIMGQLTAHNQGVLAIKELFKKPEDIRRLDFAITVASGDVALSEINAAHGEPGTPVYSSDACRELILWAWSRRPDQITFTPEATTAILRAATEMGSRYSSAIPLVEPADQRIKLARLSAACAARVFSTDESGERVIVQPEHVAFVVTYLDRIYGAPSMAYDEFSGQTKRGESLDGDAEANVRAGVEAWTNSPEAQQFFRTASIFRKSELVDGVGWDEPYTKAQLRFLRSNLLIRPVREGYVKTPVFIGLLRSMHTGVGGPDVPSEEEMPF